MNQQPNPMESYPYPVAAAQCPLLTAVLPLRYAIGHNAGIDAALFGLPSIGGVFPPIGPEHGIPAYAQLQYSRRLLRDGWLYLWLSEQDRLVEYRVRDFILSETARGGRVVDGRQLPYLILPAGVSAMLAWSPVQWSEPQFRGGRTSASVRQRVMRRFTPGALPESSPIGASAPQEALIVGDYQSPEKYRWSCEPDVSGRPDWIRTHFGMGHCEQQAWTLVDDPWGVVLDIAGLIRERKNAHEAFSKQRSEDWAMAGVLRSLKDSDEQLAGKLAEITDLRRLSQAWQELDTVGESYDADLRRLSELWAAWMGTLDGQGAATLNTAAGHFDITQADHREALEQHFALACLGPAGTSLGAVAVRIALEPKAAPTKPWLLWALLGVGRRLDVGQLKQILTSFDAAKDNLPAIAGASLSMSRALALSAGLNAGANRLTSFTPARSAEPLFAAIAPAIGNHMRRLPEQVDDLVKFYFAAALGRSDQRLEVAAATRRQVGEWLSEQMGTRIPLPPEALASRSTLATALDDAIPMMRIVTRSSAESLSTPPSPGYGSSISRQADISHVGPRPLNVSGEELYDLSKRALSKAPLKSSIALFSAFNFELARRDWAADGSLRNTANMLGGGFGVATAAAAVSQKLLELDWGRAVHEAGHSSSSARELLQKSLGVAWFAQFAQAATSGFDIIIFGYESIDAYQHSDFDTAAVNAGLAVASTAQLALAVKAFRAYRAARLAVAMGQVAALRAGTALLGGGIGALTVGLTLTVLGGLVARSYTQNTPLERWVSRTRFGTRPEVWATSYSSEMIELYKVVFPVTLELERYPELNPRTGSHVEVTWLILRLPGQAKLVDEMIRFEGEEEWDGNGWFRRNISVPVAWTGKDFDQDIGDRRPKEVAVARYRRVYHLNSERGRLASVKGVLTYSPLEGVTLPPITVNDSTWL